MGFWHTGYIEFHEEVGLGEGFIPKPIIHSCLLCEKTFPNLEALRSHRFECHPYNRPILLLQGMEVGSTTLQIVKSINPNDIETINCTNARVNGVAVDLCELGKKLAQKSNETVVVELNNEGVESEFRLQFLIASDSDLKGVDNCFYEVARRGRLDMRAIEYFITTAAHYPSAIEYYDGICEYFYGVLAKEKTLQSALPYDAYHDKFSRAMEKLKEFRRPLSNTICALIAFHFNHFREAIQLAGGYNSRVSIAAERYALWVSGDPAANVLLSRKWDEQLEQLLTDFETERLVSWSVANSKKISKYLGDIEALLQKEMPEFDRAKLRILLTETYALKGNTLDAKRHARELINNPGFAVWSENLIQRLSVKG